jgi:phosphomannomutase
MDNKNLPMMTVSGIRGKVGETLDGELVSRVAYMQARLAGGGRVVIGRDTRPTGASLAVAAARGIAAAGGIAVDIGVAPTPTVCVAVPALGANCGIIITASHNPLPYNGYKMVHGDGRLYRAHECEEVYAAFRGGDYPQNMDGQCRGGELLSPEKLRDTVETADAAPIHIGKILACVDVPLIKSKNMRVAVDSINGAAGAVFPSLLDALSVRWEGVNNKLNGDFVHNPEPRPEHLGDLRRLLEGGDFWGGFAFDPDADRLATLGEAGQEVSEEMTLALALQNILAKKTGPVAANLSTSMVIDDVAASYGARVFRTKIGEAHVVEGMEANNCVAGGEGNGGVIYPPVCRARDGLTGMALILEKMAETGKKLYELAMDWPVYYIVKDKIPCGDTEPEALINKLGAVFKNENKDMTDGLKIIRDYGWVHLRASNTEPIIRCYAEAKGRKQAEELAETVLSAAGCSRYGNSL